MDNKIELVKEYVKVLGTATKKSKEARKNSKNRDDYNYYDGLYVAYSTAKETLEELLGDD